MLIVSLGVQLLNKGGYFTKEGKFGLLKNKPPIGKRDEQMVMKPWHGWVIELSLDQVKLEGVGDWKIAHCTSKGQFWIYSDYATENASLCRLSR